MWPIDDHGDFQSMAENEVWVMLGRPPNIVGNRLIYAAFYHSEVLDYFTLVSYSLSFPSHTSQRHHLCLPPSIHHSESLTVTLSH
jgi:hypothetical protein